MKNLLKIALKMKGHASLLVGAILLLILLTIANQCEMLTLGVIMRGGQKLLEGSGGAGNSFARWIGSVREMAAFSNTQFLILLLVSVAIFKAIALFSSRYIAEVLSIKISRDLREAYFRHIQLLPMSFYETYNIGSLSSRVVGDAGQIAQSLRSMIINYLQTPFTIFSTLGICFYLSWQLSLVIFVGIPLVVIPIVFLTRRVKMVTRQLLKNQEGFAGVLIDFLSGIHTVKIFAMEAFSFKKYREENDQMAYLEKKTAKYDLLTRPILHTITSFCLAFVILFGLQVLKLPLSEILVFCGLLHLLYEPVKKFAEENTNIQKGVVAAERLMEVLSLPIQEEDEKASQDWNGDFEEITFRDVWFRYGEEWVLKGVSFSIKRGEMVAIAGATGSGKSTILQLLPRLYSIERGEILIDGVSLDVYNAGSLREQIAFVPQKSFLFHDTIRANIAFGRAFSDAEIEKAAREANAEQFIQEFPLSYDTVLAEAGKNLSGGQQQRLAIARALLKKAPILLLDEATASLDTLTENSIKQAFSLLRGDVTQIIVAHRLSTIEHADKILFLQNGEKIGEGSREELLASCPPFRAMWESHFTLPV